MDDKSNFEQQFSQKVKSSVPAQAYAPATASTTGGSKLPLVIAIVLAAITLVESIALVTTLNNYFSVVNGDDVSYDEEIIADDGGFNNDAYVYDNDYNLTAIGVTCTSNAGSTITLDTSNKYTGSLGSGTYTITNDSLISLPEANKVLYYDGIDIADGLTIYTCEEVATEADTSDTITE